MLGYGHSHREEASNGTRALLPEDMRSQNLAGPTFEQRDVIPRLCGPSGPRTGKRDTNVFGCCSEAKTLSKYCTSSVKCNEIRSATLLGRSVSAGHGVLSAR